MAPLVFWKSEPQYGYKRYAYKKHVLIYTEYSQGKGFHSIHMVFKAFLGDI